MRYSNTVVAGLLFIMSGSVFAQHTPPAPSGGASGVTTPVGPTSGYMSQDDIKGLADFVDTTRRLESKDLVSKPLATKRSTVMLGALHIECQLTDAQQIASGKGAVDGKPVGVGLYEVACSNGMGYLLTLIGLSSASGISCFAASATLTPDPADAAKVELKCTLPANADLDNMASTVMRNAGTACDVRDLKWLGQGADPKVDYTEVACKDDRGFVLRTPAPGAVANIDVLSCKDAVGHGASCHLTRPESAAAAPAAADEPRPNLQWFKDALTQNSVSCDVKKARIIGRESIKRRYIVEYQCPQQHPLGLVAYVPSASDSINPFESIDCNAAALRKIACQFTEAH